MNGSDIALVIGAVCTGVPIVGGFILQCLTYRKQALRDSKLDSIEHKVNGLTASAVGIALRAGQAEGHAKGVADERADPQSSSAPIAAGPSTPA